MIKNSLGLRFRQVILLTPPTNTKLIWALGAIGIFQLQDCFSHMRFLGLFLWELAGDKLISWKSTITALSFMYGMQSININMCIDIEKETGRNHSFINFVQISRILNYELMIQPTNNCLAIVRV